ncbi:hypothetical protein ACJJH9_15660 [Microbulbifer sp. DLAB2-AF]|uniref:hypothetical protein n=1 Tax=Microbulbifer sp. DLAB2-AF TaxID=3243395 RepID=UPI0040399716
MKYRYVLTRINILKGLLASFIVLQSITALSDVNRTDFDLDDDGLIEINDLADFNEILNNLEGASLYEVSTGCTSSGCRRFESNAVFDFKVINANGDHAILTSEQDPYIGSCAKNEASESGVSLSVGIFLPIAQLVKNCPGWQVSWKSDISLSGAEHGGQLAGIPHDVMIINDSVYIGSEVNSGGESFHHILGEGHGQDYFPSPDGHEIIDPTLGNYIASLATYFHQSDLPSHQVFTDLSQVYSDAGEVTVDIQMALYHTDEPYSLAYSWSSPTLVPLNGFDKDSFIFDPAEINGTHEINLEVTHSSGGSTSTTTLIRVEESLPELSDTEDTDGDGLSDLAEGVIDLDKDKIPDYLDKKGDGNLLPVDIGGAQIQSVEGASLVLGDSAYMAGRYSSNVTLSDIDKFYSENLATQNNYQFLHGIFDFIVRETDIGSNTQVVIPLKAALLADARYIKYRQGVGWMDFVEDDKNYVASASGKLGACPSPGSDEYKSGLKEGYYCLQLTIEDGGPNDADGDVNGSIVDLGAIATLGVAEPVVTIKSEEIDKYNFQGEGEQVVLSLLLESDSADAVLNGLTLKAEGSLNEVEDLKKVKLYFDANSDGTIEFSEHMGTALYASDNSTLTFTLDDKLQLPVGETRWFVTYTF